MAKKKMTKKQWLFAIIAGLALGGIFIAISENGSDSPETAPTTSQSTANQYADIQPLVSVEQNPAFTEVAQQMGNLWWLSREAENRIDRRPVEESYFGNEFSDKKQVIFDRLYELGQVLDDSTSDGYKYTNEVTFYKNILIDMNAIIWQWSFNGGMDTDETKDMAAKMNAYFPNYLHNAN